jgi:hypothetical protein
MLQFENFAYVLKNSPRFEKFGLSINQLTIRIILLLTIPTNSFQAIRGFVGIFYALKTRDKKIFKKWKILKNEMNMKNTCR